MQDYIFLKEKIRNLDVNNKYLTTENCEYVLKCAQEKDDITAQGYAYTALAFYGRSTSNTQMMLDNTYKLLNLSEKSENYSTAAQAMNIIGIYYYDLRQHSLAIKYYFDAIKLYLKDGNNYGVSCVYQNIANLYVYMDDFEKSKYFFYKAKDYLDLAENTISREKYLLVKLQMDISYCFYLLKANEWDKVPVMINEMEKNCLETNHLDFMIFVKLAKAKYSMGTNDINTFKSLIYEIIEIKDIMICNYEYFADFCDCFDYSLQINDFDMAEKILSVLDSIVSRDKISSMVVGVFRRRKELFNLTGRTNEFNNHKIDYFNALKAESSAMDSERHEFINSKLEILKNNEKNKKKP